MRARSLTRWAEKIGGWTVSTHQALEETHGLYHFGVHTYNWIQRHAPWLHHLYFNYLELAGMFRTAQRIMGRQRFVKKLQELRPDLIVSVHGSTNHGFFDLAHETLAGIPCVTYCGELFGGYGFSKHWANPGADLFIGAVSETCEAAETFGVPESRRWTGGFLLDPDFYTPPLSPEEKHRILKEELQLDPDIFTLLLGTGAVGANNHLAFLKALQSEGLRLQVIVLCGTNQATYNKVKRWADHQTTLTVRPLHYTREMKKWLQVSSAVVARPGTGTTSEAMVCGCPIIHNGIGGIMPQEWITVKFTRHHGISETVHRASQLPPIVHRWMEAPEKLQRLRERIQSSLPPGHPKEILERLTSLVGRSVS